MNYDFQTLIVKGIKNNIIITTNKSIIGISAILKYFKRFTPSKSFF